MLPFYDAFDCDAAALALVTHDVSEVPDEMLIRPTPCSEWTVQDLIDHMNSEHVAICGGSDAGADPRADPRADFAVIADRWLQFFTSTAGTTVHVPKVGRDLPVEHVLSVHFADMLVHRWDLAASLGATPTTPHALLDKAFSVARSITAPDSPLVGEHGVYSEALPPDPTAEPIENLVRMYGRDHRFEPSVHGSP